MSAVIFRALSWPTLGCALLIWGFAPGVALRLIVLLFPPDHPRRRELLGELYGVPRIDRPFWVAEQLGTGLSDGLGSRLASWRARRMVPASIHVALGGRECTLQLRVTPELWHAGLPAERFAEALDFALKTGAAKPVAILL
jgi:hypothetical protein